MLTAKPLASLSSGLLARKGQAKPAMRPQGFGGFSSPAAALDDLGWNDMGGPEPAASSAPAPYVAPAPAEPVRPTPVPPVVALREALKAEVAKEVAAPEPSKLAAEPQARPPESSKPAAEPQARPAESRPGSPEPAESVAARPVSLATAARIGRDSAKQTKKGKAAFTLRLDGDRHLKLRLASALSGRSAQLLVTEAVDRLLAEMTEVDALIAQLPESKRR